MLFGDETAEKIVAKRAVIKKEYGNLFETVSEILFRHDPIWINFEDNTDEYDPEVGTILPRLKYCYSSEDVLAVIHEEFNKWFNDDDGNKDGYPKIAEEVWTAWQISGLAKN